MYNTGDLGAWRQDGEIEMLGRVDDQIKIKVWHDNLFLIALMY